MVRSAPLKTLTCVTFLAGAAIFSAPAQAQANTKYASIVVDAETGQVLHARYADNIRYPASLTKMMTLYLLFEAIEAGDVSWSESLTASKKAQDARPSELDLRKGDTIRVDEAVRSLVTKSANDVAIVIAERLGGSESHFASLMNAKAKSLGMTQTRFVNASGWPDTRQTSTARDLVILAERLMEDYPQYYSYFSTPSFTWEGITHKNHNNLLKKAEGVDGIKTGYTAASGFNVATSVERNGVRLVAVVMGGKTAASRDAHMIELINAAYREVASDPMRREQLIAELGAAQSRILEPGERLSSQGAAAPIREASPKETPGAVRIAAASPEASPGAGPGGPQSFIRETAAPDYANADFPDSDAFEIAGVGGPIMYSVPPQGSVSGSDGSADERFDRAASVVEKGDWSVQVGAYLSAARAEERLQEVHNLASWRLAQAEPAVEPVARDGKKLYRAQFRGLSEASAQSACDELNDMGHPCFALAMQHTG